MTGHDADHDNVLKELDAALQVEPSRAFADGVRARVNRTRTNTARVWRGLAAAAGIGLATLALWRPAPEPTSVAAVTQVTVAPITQPTATASPVTTPPSLVAASQRAVSRGERIVTPVVATASASETRLEVITNQGAVLRDLWAAAGTGAMFETALEAPIPVTPAEVKPIAPIVLDPIVVTPIVLTEIGKGSGPEGATPVIRRANATTDAAKETR